MDELAQRKSASRSVGETPSDTLRALADRCEREEPSIVLEQAIARALGFHVQDLTCTVRGGNFRLPSYTTSLDAAVTLAPKNRFGWNLESKDGGTHANAMVARKHFGQANTEAMALCAAALRARAVVLEQEGDRNGTPRSSEAA